jgi:glutamine synthetase
VPSVYWGKEADTTNLEIKCVDSSCNPYLALAAVIACGMDGVERMLEPPDPIDCDPSTLSDEKARMLGVRRLPTSLKEALAELENDSLLKEVLGEAMSRVFVIVKSSEHAAFAAKDVDFELTQHRNKF